MRLRHDDDPEEDEEIETWPYPSTLWVDYEPEYVVRELVSVDGEPLIQIWSRCPCGFAVPGEWKVAGT